MFFLLIISLCSLGISDATNDVLSGISNGGLPNVSTIVHSNQTNETAKADMLRRKRQISDLLMIAKSCVQVVSAGVRYGYQLAIAVLEEAVDLKRAEIKEEREKIIKNIRNVTALLSEQMDVIVLNFDMLSNSFSRMEDQLAGVAMNTEVIAGATKTMADIHESRNEKHPIGLCLRRVNVKTKTVYYFSSLAKEKNLAPYMTIENLPQAEATSGNNRVWCIHHEAPACTMLRVDFFEPAMQEILERKAAMLFQCHHLKITESSCINLNTNFDPRTYKDPYCYDAAYPHDYNRFPRIHMEYYDTDFSVTGRKILYYPHNII